MSKKPVPKKKQAVSSSRSRHSKYVFEKRRKLDQGVQLSKCQNCGAMHRAHYACEACGYYNGRLVLEKKGAEQDSKAKVIEA